MAAQVQTQDWGKMDSPAKLTDQQWAVVSLLGLVLIAMAVLQVVSFTDFKGWLETIGLSSPATWAVIIIVAEVCAALGFFKLKLMSGFRMLSAWFAILVSGWWFMETLRLVSEGKTGRYLTNSGYFGRFLHQSPGWWTVIEATVLLSWVIYGLKLTRE